MLAFVGRRARRRPCSSRAFRAIRNDVAAGPRKPGAAGGRAGERRLLVAAMCPVPVAALAVPSHPAGGSVIDALARGAGGAWSPAGRPGRLFFPFPSLSRRPASGCASIFFFYWCDRRGPAAPTNGILIFRFITATASLHRPTHQPLRLPCGCGVGRQWGLRPHTPTPSPGRRSTPAGSFAPAIPAASRTMVFHCPTKGRPHGRCPGDRPVGARFEGPGLRRSVWCGDRLSSMPTP